MNGRRSSEIHIPTTSSTTTMPGSLRPTWVATSDAARVPSANTATVAATCQPKGSHESGQKSSKPTAEPAVPGAIGE